MDIFGLGAGLVQTGINAAIGTAITDRDRRQNYLYGEQQAENADKRTRALYSDYYSPEALKRQYLEAGLSPSLMFGGTPGQGGMSGAMGSNSGQATPYMPLSLLEAAQISNIDAQTKKTEAETANINKDTDLKWLQEEWQTMLNAEKMPEWVIFSSYTPESNESLYETAEKCKDFDEFLQTYKRQTNSAVNEYERQALQKIYMSTYYLDREIAVLTNDKVSADFYRSVTEALEKEDFANLNAQSTIEYLQRNIETNKLDTQQKKAWNDLLERVGRKSATAKDVLLIVGMILDKALTQYRLPSIETGGKTININKAE